MKIIEIKENINEVMGWEENESEIEKVLIGEENEEESGICGIIYKNGKMEIVGLNEDREVKSLEEMKNWIKKGF